jgi:transcription elongation factor
MLLKEDIFKGFHCECKTVKAFGNEIKVKSLSVSQYFKFAQIQEEAKKNKDFSQLLTTVCIWAAMDDAGKPLFTEEDRQKLDDMNIDCLESLQNICSAAVQMSTVSVDKTNALKKT